MVKVHCVIAVAIVASCVAYINFSCIILLFSKYINKHEIIDISQFNWTSSVRCCLSNGTRLCSFKNVCYLPKKHLFLFTLTEHSVLLGLTSKEDLKTIYLSSVINHNLMTMKIAIVSNENKVTENAKFVDQPLFLLWRFKWDNIMHVFHDDLIPLFSTYLDICGEISRCISKYTLGFVDQGEDGPYHELYSLFSNRQPLLLHKYTTTVCFPELHSGVLSSSVWFQYGYGQTQGPVNTSVPIEILRQFKNYVVHRFGISQKLVNNNAIIFLNRKLNRKILNLEYFTSILYNTVKEAFPFSQPKIIDLDLTTHNIASLLEIFLTSKIVVGMHGSAMILCLFLTPGSVVVELFPFGIQPENVSFIKSFTEIIGGEIVYRSWVNCNETLSFAHPEAPPLLGGIYHLSKVKQEFILNTKTVPAVECCHDPLYLFRMFQDTVVGSDFIPRFQEALQAQQLFSKETVKNTYLNKLFSLWYFPAPATNISCTLQHQTLTAMWQSSINAVDSLIYDITILLDNNTLLSKTTPYPNLKINLSYIAHTAEIWIKAISLDSDSLDSHSKCLRI